MFRNPFSFNGRIRRKEYGLSVLICLFAYILYGSIAGSMQDENSPRVPDIIFFAAILWFYAAQAVKRCHDRDHVGLYAIIPYYYLWLLFADGDSYENKYGPDPKGREIGNYWGHDEQDNIT